MERCPKIASPGPPVEGRQPPRLAIEAKKLRIRGLMALIALLALILFWCGSAVYHPVGLAPGLNASIDPAECFCCKTVSAGSINAIVGADAPSCSIHVVPRLRRCKHGAPVQFLWVLLENRLRRDAVPNSSSHSDSKALISLAECGTAEEVAEKVAEHRRNHPSAAKAGSVCKHLRTS